MKTGYMWIVSEYLDGKLQKRYTAMCHGLQAVNDHCAHYYKGYGLQFVEKLSDNGERWFENGAFTVVYER